MIEHIDTFSPILLNAGLAIHRGDWNYTNISNPFFRLYLVVEGEARLTVKGKSHRLLPGHLYLIPPYTLHDDSCTGLFSLYYIHVYDNSKQALSLFDQYECPVSVPAEPFAIDLFKRLLTINDDMALQQYDPKSYTNEASFRNSLIRSDQKSIGTQLETKGILYQLMAPFFEGARPVAICDDTRVLHAVQYIREHLYSRISLNDLAEQCNVSKDHLIRLFRLELNCTPVVYINRKKIERAQLMLLQGNKTIKEVAYALAFDNISYFNKQFKRILGKTPTLYIKESALIR